MLVVRDESQNQRFLWRIAARESHGRVAWWVPVEERRRSICERPSLAGGHAPAVLLPESGEAVEFGSRPSRAKPRTMGVSEVVDQGSRQPAIANRAQVGDSDTKVSVCRTQKRLVESSGGEDHA